MSGYLHRVLQAIVPASAPSGAARLRGGDGPLLEAMEPRLMLDAVSRLPGDATGDGTVDVYDLAVLANNYHRPDGCTWGNGDFDGDGAVDVSDLWPTTTGGPSASC